MTHLKRRWKEWTAAAVVAVTAAIEWLTGVLGVLESL